MHLFNEIKFYFKCFIVEVGFDVGFDCRFIIEAGVEHSMWCYCTTLNEKQMLKVSFYNFNLFI